MDASAQGSRDLRRLRDVLPDLVDALADAVVVVDRDRRVVATNRRYDATFGERRVDLGGSACTDTQHLGPAREVGREPCAACEVFASRAPQRRLWQMARDRSASPYGGASPVGWTATLNDLGLGPYRLVSAPTFDAALTTAARALTQTKRPVGLVMWAGRHAWVMTGFEATGNPRRDPDARVTRIRVMDPLYPHGSRWGRSPAPDTLIGRKQLKRQFVVRIRPDYPLGVAPGWLLVLPVR